jgi:hypothetical protein
MVEILRRRSDGSAPYNMVKVSPRRRQASRGGVALAVVALSMGPSVPAQQRGAPALTQLNETGLVGLVELPWIYGVNGPPPDEPLTARAQPGSGAAAVAVLDPIGVRTPGGERVCRWVRDLDRQAGDPPGCEFVEAGYEIPALRVLAVADAGWFRVELTGSAERAAWIQTDNRFHSVIDLLASGEHLTYLDLRRWDRQISVEPSGSRAEFRHPALQDRREAPYEALGHVIYQGRLWLHVRILDEICVARDPVEIGRGWIPAMTAAGDLNAWFWSRGC